MKYLSFHENKRRGSFDFPIELYYVDASHPRYEMPVHWHVESELIFVLQGKLHLSVEGETLTLTQGESVFLSAGLMHGGIPEECIYECLVFDFERFFQDSIICRERFQAMLGEAMQIQRYFAQGSEAAKLIDAIFAAMETEQRGYEFTTTGLLWQFTGLVLNQQLYLPQTAATTRNAKRAEQIKKALRYIHAGYAKEVTLEQLAAQAEMAPKYFCRVFREITGRTPIDYLNYYRIECAGELLCASQESVTEVALSCGFDDLSYFVRLFKRYKGVSARVYKKQHSV